MGRPIVKIKDKYLEWSTIVDAPVTYGMTTPELKAYIRFQYGAEGLEELPPRLARADQHGTSALPPSSFAGLIESNRAGDNETHLSIEEIYERYCTQSPFDTGGKDLRMKSTLAIGSRLGNAILILKNAAAFEGKEELQECLLDVRKLVDKLRADLNETVDVKVKR